MAKKEWIKLDEAVNILTDLSNGIQIVEVSKKYNRSRFTIMNLMKREQKFIAEGIAENSLYEKAIEKRKNTDELKASLEVFKHHEAKVVKFERPKAVYSNQKSLYD